MQTILNICPAVKVLEIFDRALFVWIFIVTENFRLKLQLMELIKLPLPQHRNMA